MWLRDLYNWGEFAGIEARGKAIKEVGLVVN